MFNGICTSLYWVYYLGTKKPLLTRVGKSRFTSCVAPRLEIFPLCIFIRFFFKGNSTCVNKELCVSSMRINIYLKIYILYLITSLIKVGTLVGQTSNIKQSWKNMIGSNGLGPIMFSVFFNKIY